MFCKSFPKFFCLVVGLIFINGIIFSQSSSGSWNPDPFGFNSRILDSRFDRADREITPQKWIEEARRGIESARILWEEIIPELYRDTAMLETLSFEFDKWTESELEKRFTDWLLNRFFGSGLEQLTIEVIRERERADKLFLYKTDEEGNILFDEKTGDPLLIRPSDEGYNYESDLYLWRKQIEDSANAEIKNFETQLIQLFPELLIYIEENRREDFGGKLAEISKTTVQSMQNEFESLIAREQRLFTARRLGDIYSLRKKSENESASSVSASLIEEARRITNEGIAVLEAKIEAAEAGNGDLALVGTEWLSQYREQFERGLRAWEEAEERFFIRRVEWEQDAIFNYYEAEAAWNVAFRQFDEARREWEYKAKDLFESGELLFKNASAILEKTILEAKAEFAKDSRIRTESATEKAKAWAKIYINALSAAAEASINIDLWGECLAKEPDHNSENYRSIFQKIDNCIDIFNFYNEKAIEAKNFLQIEFSIVMGSGSLYDVLSYGVSSEDFFLDEYQMELLRSQAVAGYWSKRVAIAQAVLNYAEDLTAGRVTESEGLASWEKAKIDYDNALTYYQNCMESFEVFEFDSHQIHDKMKDALAKLQSAEAELEGLNQTYANLIAAYEDKDGDLLKDKIANRNNELIEIAKKLDSTGSDSIMMSYIKEAYKIGLIEEVEFKTELLKELILGGLFFEKSLAELSQIAQDIKIFDENDTLPDSIEGFGISKDDPLYAVLEDLLEEKNKYLSEANEEERSSIIKKYDAIIYALSLSAKKNAIRQEQNRIMALELLISSDIKPDYENQLYKDWENACQELFRVQVELDGYSFTDLFLDQYIAEIETIEAMMIAYKFAELINPVIAESTKNEKVQNLYSKYTELGFECEKLILDDINSLVEALIIDSDDAVFNAIQFLQLLDDVVEYFPSWVNQEVRSWKDMFLALFSYKISEITLSINETDILTRIAEIEFENITLSIAYQNGLLNDYTPFLSLKKELNLLFYQLEIIERVSKTKSYFNNKSFLNSLARRTEMINIIYAIYEDDEASSMALFYDTIKTYIEQPYLEWDESFLSELPLYPDDLVSLINDFDYYMYYEQILYDEIEELTKNLDLKNEENGSLEEDIERILEKIKLQNEKIGQFTDEYYGTSDNFSILAKGYDSQYAETKNAYSIMEEKRHEYEIQDAIRRWASTAYLDIHDTVLELHTSQEKLKRAEAVLELLKELNLTDTLIRPDKNTEYQVLYNEYFDGYTDLHISIKAFELLKGELLDEMVKNESLLNTLRRQLVLLGGDFTFDFFNRENDFLQRLIDIIWIEDNKLLFLRDDYFNLFKQTEEERKILNEFFSNNGLSEYGMYTLSGFELALLDFNQRLESYFFTFDKYVQWGAASNFLLSQMSEIFINDTMELVGVQDFINCSEYFKNAWNSISEDERKDLEFFVILNLVISNGDLFNEMSEYIHMEIVHQNAYDEFIRLHEICKNPIAMFIYYSKYKKASYELSRLRPSYNELVKRVKDSLKNFTTNIGLLNSKYDDFTKSSERLLVLNGITDNPNGLSWNDIELGLTSAGLSFSEIRKIENYWLEATLDNDLSNFNLLQTLNFILRMKRTEIIDTQLEFEKAWRKMNEEHIIAEKEYFRQYELYLLGDISIEDLSVTAIEAFGNNRITLKNHLNNIEQLIRFNMGVFFPTDDGLKQAHDELVTDYIRLIERANNAKYSSELNVREAEWEIQRRDIEEKHISWLDSSRQILERGWEDWKNNSVKLNEAYSLWLRTFEDEYRKTSEAWTAAFLESQKDKEAWVERATLAAEEASSQALLILIGSDGEAGARAMDTRDPVNYRNSNGLVEAQKTLDELLNKSSMYRLDDIFDSANSIAGTVNTTIRRGLSMSNIADYGLVQIEASRLAKTVKEDISALQSVRIAINLKDMIDQAISRIAENVDRANENVRKQIDNQFIVKGGWRRSGFDYRKDVAVHSTFSNPLITESVFVEGYVYYDLAPVHISTNLNDDNINYLDSIAVHKLMESLMLEISETANRIFGSSNTEDNNSSKGEFGKHIGEAPKEEDGKKISEAKSADSVLYGSGELGRLMTNYVYWDIKEKYGLAMLDMAPWDKPLWDSRGSFFDAPSLKTTVSIGIQIAATVVTGGALVPIASALMGIGTDYFFGIFDVAGGYKSWAEAGVNFGKSVLTNALGAAAGTFSGNMAKHFTSAVSSGAVTQFGADMGSLIVTGVKDITVGTINSAISAVTYSDKDKWGWSNEAFSAGITSSLKSSLVTATGSLTTGILNTGLIGFTNELYSNGGKLNNLAGGLAGQGVNYALGGDFTLNLFNMSIFNTEETNYNLGLLELSLGKNGASMTLGTGGIDASIGTLSSAVKGLETWIVNAELFLSNKEATNKYKSQLRTIYSDKDTRHEYENVLAGKTVYEERRKVEYTQSIYDENTGVKTVYLGSDALNDGSRFGLNVIFSHESYRNGIRESDELQEIKTSNAFYGHSKTALDIVSTYGINSLGDRMGLEAIVYLDYLITGNNGLMETILGTYDSSDEYWKLIRNENDMWSWDKDQSHDFDISELLLALDLQGDGSARDELDTLSILSGFYDENGIISAERMNSHVAGLLGNAIISQSMQNGIFEYGDLDAQSKAARNFLIKDTMNKMAINSVLTTGVYNEISPMILGKGSGDDEYDYLVPFLTGAGHALYMQVDREQFLTYYDLLFVAAAMQQNGKNYVWGGKDPEKDGGLDCSGLTRWAQMQVYGKNISIRNAHDQMNDDNLTIKGNGGLGSLNYYTDNNGIKYHHVGINLGDGTELHANGNESNKRENPGIIEIRYLPQLQSHQKVENRRTNWHYLFFE